MSFADKIYEYYINGYGIPKKYYTDSHLDMFLKNKMITQKQVDLWKLEKQEETAK